MHADPSCQWPDLAPSDYASFDSMKEVMRRKSSSPMTNFMQLSVSGAGIPPKNGMLRKYGSCQNYGTSV
ncbi:hypothetical protein C0J52_27320 [Blattella germanica]|nr:hypothetical protein C0J52_27320 [Blattella germanica]